MLILSRVLTVYSPKTWLYVQGTAGWQKGAVFPKLSYGSWRKLLGCPRSGRTLLNSDRLCCAEQSFLLLYDQHFYRGAFSFLLGEQKGEAKALLKSPDIFPLSKKTLPLCALLLPKNHFHMGTVWCSSFKSIKGSPNIIGYIITDDLRVGALVSNPSVFS